MLICCTLGGGTPLALLFIWHHLPHGKVPCIASAECNKGFWKSLLLVSTDWLWMVWFWWVMTIFCCIPHLVLMILKLIKNSIKVNCKLLHFQELVRFLLPLFNILSYCFPSIWGFALAGLTVSATAKLSIQPTIKLSWMGIAWMEIFITIQTITIIIIIIIVFIITIN